MKPADFIDAQPVPADGRQIHPATQNEIFFGFDLITQMQIALLMKSGKQPNHIRPNLLSTRAAKRASYTRQQRKANFGLFSHGITHHFETMRKVGNVHA